LGDLFLDRLQVGHFGALYINEELLAIAQVEIVAGHIGAPHVGGSWFGLSVTDKMPRAGR
jgi:hypothetical protein